MGAVWAELNSIKITSLWCVHDICEVHYLGKSHQGGSPLKSWYDMEDMGDLTWLPWFQYREKNWWTSIWNWAVKILLPYSLIMRNLGSVCGSTKEFKSIGMIPPLKNSCLISLTNLVMIVPWVLNLAISDHSCESSSQPKRRKTTTACATTFTLPLSHSILNSALKKMHSTRVPNATSWSKKPVLYGYCRQQSWPVTIDDKKYLALRLYKLAPKSLRRSWWSSRGIKYLVMYAGLYTI